MISVKTLRGFLDGVASLYAKAKKPLSRLVDKRVVKGRAKCVASQAEELFADFICKSILRTKKGYKVFVDFPITVKPGRDGKKSETRYIDFILVRVSESDKYEILYMAELKLNTGWMRDRVSECANDMRSLRDCLREGDISAREPNLNSGRVKFVFNQRAFYDLIIFSGANADLTSLKKEVKLINSQDDNTKAAILCDGPIVKGCEMNKRGKTMIDRRIRLAAFRG